MKRQALFRAVPAPARLAGLAPCLPHGPAGVHSALHRPGERRVTEFVPRVRVRPPGQQQGESRCLASAGSKVEGCLPGPGYSTVGGRRHAPATAPPPADTGPPHGGAARLRRTGRRGGRISTSLDPRRASGAPRIVARLPALAASWSGVLPNMFPRAASAPRPMSSLTVSGVPAQGRRMEQVGQHVLDLLGTRVIQNQRRRVGSFGLRRRELSGRHPKGFRPTWHPGWRPHRAVPACSRSSMRVSRPHAGGSSHPRSGRSGSRRA